MREPVKTSLFTLAAIALAVAASLIEPETATPDIFSDKGETFFPRLTDPNAVKALEVVEYDEATATARPFKVEFRRGRWLLASHYNYPADARDRLAKTAAALVDLRKDEVRSDLADDHAKYFVIDPLDPKATSLTGRGKRVTLRDAQGQVLADLILGAPLKDKSGYRHARVPGQKRIYAVKTDADPSARFEDWVEAGLLRLSAASLRRITIHSYSINEALGRLENVENLPLAREKDTWKLAGADKLNTAAVSSLTSTLDNLKIAGVRPKPDALKMDLKSRGAIHMSMEIMMSLRQIGFFITPDGRLLSNEGELVVETSDGLLYTLRFGEIQVGAPAAGAPPAAPATAASKPADANRYLFVTVVYDPARAAKYADAGAAPGSGERLARDLTARFADWYYLISPADFSKLRLKRKDLVR